MHYQKTIGYLTLSLFFAFQTNNAQNLASKFQAILDSTYNANKDVVGILMHIESSGDNISWSGAAGFSDKTTHEKLHKNQPVLVASNTKTYIAASILKLVENKQLQLDNSIHRIISEKTRYALQQAGYLTEEITVRHLLSHTSGITDYVSESYFSFIDEHKQYKWTREEQIELSMKIASPTSPGESFAYGDINYLLLSEILENKKQKAFYLAVSDLLDFDKNGLHNTWFINLEEKPSHSLALAHQYAAKYNWDSYDVNPSWDLYGGGGLAATTKDIALFFELLFEGEIIKDKALLAEIYTYVLPRELTRNYCLGLYHIPSFFGKKVYYHGGWWGTDVIYLPDYHTSITVFSLSKEKRNLNGGLSNRIFQEIAK